MTLRGHGGDVTGEGGVAMEVGGDEMDEEAWQQLKELNDKIQQNKDLIRNVSNLPLIIEM